MSKAKTQFEKLAGRAMELLTPDEKEEYARIFGEETVTTLVEKMSYTERRLDSSIRDRLSKPIKNRLQLRDLLWAMADYTGLPRIPTAPVCDNHCAPFDSVSAAFFGHSPNYLKHANRHGYKTMGDAFLMFVESVMSGGCKSKILGGSGTQSKNVYEYIQLLDDIPACHELLQNVFVQKAQFRNRSEVSMLTQSMKSVRGPHPQKLRLDEIEEFDPQVFRAALATTRSYGGVPSSIGMGSTHHRRSGIMAELLKDHTKRGIALFQWCIFEVMEQCKQKSCKICKAVKKKDYEGNEVSFYDFCQGKAKRSRGYYSLAEVLEKFTLLPLEDFKAEWLCQAVSLSGYVFPKFEAEEEMLHVSRRAAYDPTLPTTRTWDFGWSGATVILWLQVDGDRQKRVIDEQWFVMTPFPEICKQIKAKLYQSSTGRVLDYGDPAVKGGKDKIIGIDDLTYLRSQGFDIISKASGIPQGIRLINEALEPINNASQLIVNPICEHLIEYLKDAKYPVDAQGQPVSEIPIKDGKEHPGDALRYWFIHNEAPVVAPAYGGRNPGDKIVLKEGKKILVPAGGVAKEGKQLVVAGSASFGFFRNQMRRRFLGLRG